MRLTIDSIQKCALLWVGYPLRTISLCYNACQLRFSQYFYFNKLAHNWWDITWMHLYDGLATCKGTFRTVIIQTSQDVHNIFISVL